MVKCLGLIISFRDHLCFERFEYISCSSSFYRIAMGAGTNCGCRLSSFLSHRRMNGENPTTYAVTSNSIWMALS